jgi:uncharacterized membrane protein (DUF2068 family)
VDWSLLSCGRSGHVTYAPDEPTVREQISSPTPDGPAWRCLRCTAFVPGEPGGHGPASSAPQPRRDEQVRSRLILRLFAIERFIRVLLFASAAVVVWRFESDQASIDSAFDRDYPALRTLFRELGWNIDHSKLVGLVNRALTLSPSTIRLLVIGLAVYAAVELIEGIGLWLGQRWGEYFAMVVTALGLPYEIYDLSDKITVTRVIFFLVNLALVLYLIITKRLLGVRGGKAAYEARLHSESVMQAAIDATSSTGTTSTTTSPGRPTTASSAGAEPIMGNAGHSADSASEGGTGTTRTDQPVAVAEAAPEAVPSPADQDGPQRG